MFVPSADGGMAQYAQELLRALSADTGERYRYELVSSQDLHEQFKAAEYPTHPILPILKHRTSFATPLHWIASRLTHYWRREQVFVDWLERRPDVAAVHFQEWTPWLAPSLIKQIKRMGKKVFHTAHNVTPHHYPLGIPKSVVNGWIRRASRSCDGLFVHTNRLAEELTRFLGSDRPNPPIHVVPHGVWSVRDVHLIPPLEHRLSWKRLLFFGSIRRNKGLHLLLSAMDQLPDFSLTIAGEPLERQYFQMEILPQIQRLRERGVQIDLTDHFLPDSEIGPLFARHSAVMLPYTPQFVAQSGVVFMALAYELPVIASNAGGLGEILREFKIGTTFEQSSPTELAAAVRSLYAPRGVGSGLQDEILAAKRRYSWREAARATLCGYSKAVQLSTEAHDRVLETSAAV